MNPKDLVIVNELDRPCVQLIAHIKANGRVGYLNNDVKSRISGDYDAERTMTTLEQFGFDFNYNQDLKDFEYFKSKESTATYSDGRPRKWQGKEKFTLSEIYNSSW